MNPNWLRNDACGTPHIHWSPSDEDRHEEEGTAWIRRRAAQIRVAAEIRAARTAPPDAEEVT